MIENEHVELVEELSFEMIWSTFCDNSFLENEEHCLSFPKILILNTKMKVDFGNNIKNIFNKI